MTKKNIKIKIEYFLEDYSSRDVEQQYWILNDKLRNIKASLAIIDAQIEQDLYDLPNSVNAAAQDMLDKINTDNHNYGSIVGLIALGRVFR